MKDEYDSRKRMKNQNYSIRKMAGASIVAFGLAAILTPRCTSNDDSETSFNSRIEFSQEDFRDYRQPENLDSNYNLHDNPTMIRMDPDSRPIISKDNPAYQNKISF
ncbi:MAG: hypothetical protein WDZ69_00440 [Candidatus Pacearchaeota archaeon]